MTPEQDKPRRNLVSNRKALHDHFVLERYEAGIALRGTEVKCVKHGDATLTGAFARVSGGKVTLYNLNIPPYNHGNRFNHEPDRPRQLLLHANQIRRLQIEIDHKGHALVPLNVYLKRGLVKVELGVCKGKRQHDKRDTLRRKTLQREAEQAMAGRR